ncbi:MAG: carcinine hydrolase/isopenicillin-N N-acyltransferase family protein [Cellulosilyticaceae bacterium]
MQWSKKLKKIGIGVGCVLLVLVLTFIGVFWSELRTLSTFEVLNDHPFYEMTYHMDYGLDEFLKKGAATDDELVSFVAGRLLKGIPLDINPGGACSTFISTTPEGDHLFNRNFDYYPSSGLIMLTSPKDGYKSISIANLGHLGIEAGNLPDKNLLSKIMTLAGPYAVLDGMNECGLAIAVLIIDDGVVHQSTGKVPITTTVAIRMILDQAATVDEAIALLGQYDMNSSGAKGYHFQIADALGNTAVVEYLDNEMHILSKEEGYVAATNFVLYQGRNTGKGHDRYEMIMENVSKTEGIMSEEESLELLLALPSSGTVERDGQTYTYGTEWSCVYNLSDLTVDICIGSNKELIYHYDLKE